MSHAVQFPFEHSYQQVAETLFARQKPSPVKNPGLICVNAALAEVLSLDPQFLTTKNGVEILAGNVIPEGADPIATVYAGHQFGGFNPQLGDGRAILLGEVIGNNGVRYDFQLKGAGRTSFSRMGDGRSPLGPVLREYILSESMAALGVPTTRSLAAVTTGDVVMRDRPLPGAILTRIARSHIRIGTFQYFAAHNDVDTLKKLADHVIARHYPESAQADNPYVSLLNQVIDAQAALIAQWQSIGFIHGVMNTDNMLVSGETVDYGPCAFMESYHPGTVFSSIDQQGRYAYGNQPAIAHWNLAQLAQSLLPLIERDSAKAIILVQEALDRFGDQYLLMFQQRMSAKIGFSEASDASNGLVSDFLSLMAEHQIDFTLGFWVLAEWLDWHEQKGNSASAIVASSLYPLPPQCQQWIQRWQQCLGFNLNSDLNGEDRITLIRKRMNACNPIFIARNHQVEKVIQAGNLGDLEPFHRLVEVLSNPFVFNPEWSNFAMPATQEQRVTQTFCGT